jgi:hypothetical protein
MLKDAYKKEVFKEFGTLQGFYCMWITNDNTGAHDDVWTEVDLPCECWVTTADVRVGFGTLDDLLDEFEDEAYEYAKKSRQIWIAA